MSDTKEAKSHQAAYWKYAIILWVIFLLGLLAIGLIFTAASKSWWGFSELPTFEQLENPQSELASEIYSADSVLIGKFFLKNRTNAEYEELPPHLVNALVSTEDRRFFRHSGIDFWSLPRLFFRTVLSRDRSGGGGSTLTQQLALNLFNKRSQNRIERIKQKLQEWIIAVRLESNYTKKEIITMYLNTVSFGHNAHGIKAAAKTYFNKEVQNLNVEEGATLVGMLKATTTYNPKKNPENSKGRRNTVLNQMVKYGSFPAAIADSLQKQDIIIDYNPSKHDRGAARYFREYLRAYLKKDWAPKHKKIDGTAYNIERDGLRIYTTIDSRMQKYAEEAVQTHMEDLQESFFSHWKAKGKKPWHDNNKLIPKAMKRSERWRASKVRGLSESQIKEEFKKPVPMKLFSWDGIIDTTLSPLDSLKYVKYFLHSGFIVSEPETGHIKAWVGGIDYNYFKYDNARPTSKRQVGSTFKPFVYTVAINSGWSMCQEVPNSSVCFEPGEHGAAARWCPDNAGSDKYAGQVMTLQKGLAKSLNRITAYLMKQIGPQPVIDMVQKMGIDSYIEPVPSICLGSADISVFEMVGAYGTYANKGVYTQPNFITRIEDKNGQPLPLDLPNKTEVLSDAEAYTMLKLLQGVTDQGTGVRLRTKYKFEGDIAGKTGTTNEHSDGWYMGITPEIVGGVWVGGDEKGIHFESLRLGSGTNMALPIWAEFMKRAYADETLNFDSLARFERPKSAYRIETDCTKYKQENIELPPAPVDEEYNYGDEFN